ncbi:TldD/PmbA family protein [Methanosphaera sp.]
MNQLLDDILKNVTKKVDHAEIYMEREQSTDVDILNDKVNHAKEENIVGLGIRVIKDQKQGFAYTTNLNKVDETITQAINNSKLNNIDENLTIIDNNKVYSKIDGLYDKKLEDIDLQEAIEYSKTLIDLVKEKGCNPTAGGYGEGIGTVDIVNSNGVEVTESTTSCGASVSVNVEDEDVVSSAYYYDLKHDKNLDLELIASKATELALSSRNAKPTETRNTSVVLDHTAAVSLLGTFFSALNSENKQRGRSKFKDSFGELIASENFNLTDDGTIPGALRSSIADDEGTPTQKTVLIEEGVLTNFIYDAYHAKKDELDVTTTANASRAGYSSVPTVGFTNLKLDFKESVDVSDIQNGIIVNSVMGAHTANPITGDFSVEALNAFEIRNGSIENPIKKAMISGNIFDIMKDVKAINSEVRQLGSCITPKILADNLRVIG